MASWLLPNQQEEQQGSECLIERYLFIIKIMWQFILPFLCVYIDIYLFNLILFNDKVASLTSVIFINTDNQLSSLNSTITDLFVLFECKVDKCYRDHN